jgi:hypothetical protein
VPIPTPVKANPGQDGLSEFGLDRTGSTYAQLERFLDPNEWIEAMPPARPPGTASGSPSKLKAIHLTKVPATAADSLPGLPPERYRASIDFDIAGDLVTYTLYSNPVFVAPPPCVGHPCTLQAARAEISQERGHGVGAQALQRDARRALDRRCPQPG